MPEPASRFVGSATRGPSICEGLRIVPTGFADYEVTSPPVVIGDTVVVGSAIQDGATTSRAERRGARAGDKRAPEVELGSNPPGPVGRRGDTWKNGSAARTAPRMPGQHAGERSRRNLVFVPTSSPSPDYFGGERRRRQPFDNSVVHRCADTGERVELPDRSSRSVGLRRVPPILFDWHDDGRSIAAIGSRRRPDTCSCWIETGRPPLPVAERAVPRATFQASRRRPRSLFRQRPHHSRAPVSRRRNLGTHRRGPAVVPGDRQQAAVRRLLHTTLTAGNARHTWQRRGHGMGRDGARSRERAARRAGEQHRG